MDVGADVAATAHRATHQRFDVTLATPIAGSEALNELAELWPRIPQLCQRELRLARRYAR